MPPISAQNPAAGTTERIRVDMNSTGDFREAWLIKEVFTPTDGLPIESILTRHLGAKNQATWDEFPSLNVVVKTTADGQEEVRPHCSMRLPDENYNGHFFSPAILSDGISHVKAWDCAHGRFWPTSRIGARIEAEVHTPGRKRPDQVTMQEAWLEPGTVDVTFGQNSGRLSLMEGFTHKQKAHFVIDAEGKVEITRPRDGREAEAPLVLDLPISLEDLR